MSVITRRLSLPELTQQILEMAKTGVYRESVFEALQPMASKKQIASAISHAKRFGLHSVASLRDEQLGTYYQLDLVKYQALQHAIDNPAHLGSDRELLLRVMEATTAVQKMLTIAGSMTLLLALAGVVSLVSDWDWLGIGCLGGAISSAGIWLLQRSLLPR